MVSPLRRHAADQVLTAEVDESDSVFYYWLISVVDRFEAESVIGVIVNEKKDSARESLMYMFKLGVFI